MNGAACWKNVNIDYSYNFDDSDDPYFTSYSGVTSYVSGLIDAGWSQTGKSVNYTTTTTYDDTASIKVNGYYLLGVSINGFNVRLTIDDTWNCSLYLIP